MNFWNCFYFYIGAGLALWTFGFDRNFYWFIQSRFKRFILVLLLWPVYFVILITDKVKDRQLRKHRICRNPWKKQNEFWE